MQFHERIRQTIKDHAKKIELFQWAAISGVSSLIYSEYVRCIQRKTFPTPRADVPTIHSVQQMLHPGGELADMLSRDMIDRMVEYPLMERFKDIPELILFRPDNIEVMKCIFDAYVIPKLEAAVAGSIAKKFNLHNNKQQEIVQNREIDMFDGKPFTDEQIEFIANETALQLLMLAPSIDRKSDNPTNLQEIYLSKGDIISINNVNALTPIYLDHQMVDTADEVMDLIKFVTSTTVTAIGSSDENYDGPYWRLMTSPFNEVLVTTDMNFAVAPPADAETENH